MNAQEQITKFQEFFEKLYYGKLVEQVRKGREYLVVDFRKLTKFDPELSEVLLEQPEETLEVAELAIKEFDLPKQVRHFYPRFQNLPKSAYIYIREIRSKHLGKFVWTTGVVRQKSDVRPQVTSARFECPSCGNVITVLQMERKFREPSRCSCGRKGKFKELAKELIDAQGIILEEASEDLEGGEQPKRINVFLKNDLVSPLNDKRSNPGSKIRIGGWITEVPTSLRDGGKSTKFDLIFNTNSMETVEEDFSDIKISKAEEEEIKELAAHPKIYDTLINSLAPSIYGHNKIKEALLLQFVSGLRKKRGDGTISRGDMHVLLVGDPGCGKSQILKRSTTVAPKARYVTGKGVSGAGLCVAPSSWILTNPGGIREIKQIIEPHVTSKEWRSGVWKESGDNSIKIQSMNENLRLQTKYPSTVWKLIAPETVLQITLQSGKKVEITQNTKLLTCEDGETQWTKSNDITIGTYVGTPRMLIGGCVEKKSIVDLITSDPVVHNVKKRVKKAVGILQRTYGTTRKVALTLGLRENQSYWSWVNGNARSNIKLSNFKKICEAAKIEWKQYVKEVSLYNGKKQKLPTYLNKKVLYLAGLIAVGGDVRKSGQTFSVRFSNSCSELQEEVQRILSADLNLHWDYQRGTDKRPGVTRTHSVFLREILQSIGIPISPKSKKNYFSQMLLHMDNSLLAYYIAGIYDGDGCVSVRKGRESNTIEYCTTSETYARQLQLIFLRYEIRATLRRRKSTQNEIKSKCDAFVLVISGYEQIKKFADVIPLRHPQKKQALKRLYPAKKENSDLDIIPCGERVKVLMEKYSIKKRNGNISRAVLQNITKNISEDNDIQKMKRLAHSDIFWEKVVKITRKAPTYTHVYDLTVEDSHNFVVDGILVHNTAAVVKDEFLGGWSLEAGALVLSNKGFVMIDEMDKMGREDRSAMHEALEQQSVSISKANIQATLRAETTVLAAANPKFGRFNQMEPLGPQIDLPPTLINRFDLIFPVKDMPDRKRDDELAAHILSLHKDPLKSEPPIATDLLRKYIAYVRQKAKPKLTEEALEELRTYYVNMRNKGEIEESAFRAIPITARQLDALVRLAEASAKIRLSTEVLREDARRAIDLLEYCLNQVARDAEGQIDIDQISTGISTTQRSKIIVVKELIAKLEDKIGKTIPIEDILDEAKTSNIPREQVESVIEKLKRQGDIFEPKRGFIQRIT